MSLKRTLGTAAARLVRRTPYKRVVLEALSDVSFEVERGTSVGVLGINGSGKSTLMQVLCGIAVPDGGSAKIRGPVLPLLEIGAGFHHELTGRENIVVFGTALGLDSGEIRMAIPAVGEFAGVSTHLDTPLKRYSSGMRARLSFAVAMRFPAEVYIFDEVLAVVDDAFRETCVEEIQALRDAGRTVLFTSHDLTTIRAVCDSGLWLEKGRVKAHGPIDEVADAYAAAQAGEGD